jgi:hypothetical protein
VVEMIGLKIGRKILEMENLGEAKLDWLGNL